MPYVVRMPTNEHMTIAEVAVEYNISRRTIGRRMQDHDGPKPLLKLDGIRGAYVFTRDEIERAFGPAPARKVVAA